MLPTLHVGDFILVNKFTYGIRLPVIDKKIIDIGSPQRGDVVVFRYPPEPSTDYIKRVIGLPGDRIGYYDKVLYVNGEPVTQRDAAQPVQRWRRGLACACPSNSASHHYEVQWMPQRPSPQGEVRGAGRAVFRDGRQPRQQQGQPLLGLRAGREPGRQGVFHLDELGQRAALPSTGGASAPAFRDTRLSHAAPTG